MSAEVFAPLARVKRRTRTPVEAAFCAAELADRDPMDARGTPQFPLPLGGRVAPETVQEHLAWCKRTGSTPIVYADGIPRDER